MSGGAAYCAAALSLVLHSGNPLLPTFRSDVRYFEAQVGGKQPASQAGRRPPTPPPPPLAHGWVGGGDGGWVGVPHQGRGWFGGGADLTPYYLNHQDITEFHDHYKASTSSTRSSSQRRGQ